jgi:hypothetical protein
MHDVVRPCHIKLRRMIAFTQISNFGEIRLRRDVNDRIDICVDGGLDRIAIQDIPAKNNIKWNDIMAHA